MQEKPQRPIFQAQTTPQFFLNFQTGKKIENMSKPPTISYISMPNSLKNSFKQDINQSNLDTQLQQKGNDVVVPSQQRQSNDEIQ